MKRFTVLSLALLLGAGSLAACGGGGDKGSARDDFLDELEQVCRDATKRLDKIAAPTSIGEVASAAKTASKVFDDAINDLSSVKIPTDNKTFKNDAEDFIANLEDRVKALDDIEAAAISLDAAVTASKVARYGQFENDGDELADSLGARRCKFAPVFPDGSGTVDTVPVDTTPVDTTPVDTAPPVTVDEGNKPFLSFGPLLPAVGTHRFEDISPDLIVTWRNLLQASSIMAPQGGTIGGVDVIDENDTRFARAFLFVADATLVPNSVEDLAAVLAEGAAITTVSIATLDGGQWTAADGTVNFVSSDGDVVLWIIALNPTDLESGLNDLIAAFS
jgi:hypothetical protein